ncbi:SDR family NAD(P)-dependent oxidoreductase [Anaerolinea thermophila]|uniref:Oxidoreductase n=1 Tax=Anaerolinea thermophila (strain DSM 14523 / JCM 11388 / NBRC 100420 / UNI-1) TaxID=926569 RepID=E8N256_ANATU|nr:SDR family oxidoreductase [Anaerolinea thermophila]BAJ65003.1 putative oxidoreductase [Anaerolinea thermophila UNI-1]
MSPFTALLTSAGREPTKSIALALAEPGARLALTDLTPMGLEDTAALVQAQGAEVSTHVADPSKGLAVRMLLDEVLERWESLDALINCPLAQPTAGMLELDEWDFQRTLESNIGGPFLMLQALGRIWREERRGGIVLHVITGGGARPPDAGKFAFTASQAGLRALTRSAVELAPLGIRVYGVCLESVHPRGALVAARLAAQILHGQVQAEPGTLFEVDNTGDWA